jgi:hypothetical protein
MVSLVHATKYPYDISMFFSSLSSCGPTEK